MQQEYPELAIDGEMQVNFAMNRELRDSKYPFTRLNGKDVNTLVFPNLSSANAGYQLLQAMDPDTEFIYSIQMGLNKPIHFTDIESSVRDIVNITAVAVIDAIVEKKKLINETTIIQITNSLYHSALGGALLHSIGIRRTY